MHIVDTHLVQMAAMEEMARLRRYEAAWNAYYGRLPAPLKVRKGQPDDNVNVNYARSIVDKGVSFLFGQDIRFELDKTQQTREEEWLDQCWSVNGGSVLLQKLALNGGVCGHVFAKLVPRTPYPRIIIIDPANIAVGWEPDDIDEIVWYRIQYAAVDPLTGDPLTIRQLIQRQVNSWKITDQEARGAGSWETTGETVWPYEWAPIVDCQSLPMPNEYWGLSDLEEDVLQLNYSINFVLSNLARIIRFHAHPKTWGKGFASNQMQIAVDETIVLQSPDAELHNLEMESDLASSITMYERLREAMHEMTRIPEVATGKLERAGALSGVALQILYQPLVEKTETKRRTYGAMLTELNRRLLALGGFGEEHHTVIHWPEMLPTDAAQEAQTALLHQQLGVSEDTLLQRLGYDPEMERAKNQENSARLGDTLLDAFDRDV